MTQTQTNTMSTTTTTTANTPVAVPRADIFETQDAFVIVLDVPGVAEKDVQLTLERDTLILQASQHSQSKQGYKLSYQEWQPVIYRRQLTLATDIDRDNIKAQCKQGVLRLHLPKASPAIARKIKVNFG